MPANGFMGIVRSELRVRHGTPRVWRTAGASSSLVSQAREVEKPNSWHEMTTSRPSEDQVTLNFPNMAAGAPFALIGGTDN